MNVSEIKHRTQVNIAVSVGLSFEFFFFFYRAVFKCFVFCGVASLSWVSHMSALLYPWFTVLP